MILPVPLLVLAAAAHAATGPIRPDRPPEAILESFEAATPAYRVSTRGQLAPKLTVRPGIARDGNASLLFELPPTGNKERNSVLLDWRLDPPADWSRYDGLALWYQAHDESSPTFTVSVYEGSGAKYWQTNVGGAPRQAGEWQLVRLPNRDWSWNWEGSKDDDNKLDLTQIKALQLEVRAAEKEPVVFALDGLGLYTAEPPYDGPVLSLRSAAKGYRHGPGEDFPFVVEVSKLADESRAEVAVVATDYWGAQKLEARPPFSGVAGGTTQEAQLVLPNRGPGYLDVVGTLSVDGEPVYRAERAVACISPRDPLDDQPNPDSIFGIWVGGGQWDVGAKWTRSYCRGSDVQLVDGQYKFRDDPPGVYAPKADPKLSYTFYFSAMPKWLSSRPERADWQKWSPTDWDDYAKFLEWVISGAKAGGFTHYEVWNEPVPYAYWMGTLESVVKLHEVTYKAIKKVQPDAVVLGPCPYTFLWEFLEQFFALGGGQWIDDVVVHAYSGRPDDEFPANLRKLRELMARHGLGDRDVYITELGYSTPRVTEHEQAQYLVRSYLYAWAAGVKLLTWHMLWDYLPDSTDPGHAILRHDQTPRPAYVAYANLTRLLERAKYLGPVEGLAPTQRGFTFEKRGQRICALWEIGDTPSKTSLPLPAPQARVVDLMGGERLIRPTAGGRCELTLGHDPLYVIADNPK